MPITYHAFPHDVALCPMATLDAYLDARAQLGNATLRDELFLCYRKPHGPATNDTLARWHPLGEDIDVRTMFHLLYLLHLLPERISWSPDVCLDPSLHLDSLLQMLLELTGY